MFTVWAVNVFSQNIDWQKDHDVGCLNCQKFPPRYIFVKTLSVALAKSSISNIEAIYIKKSVSETVCAKHSLFFVLLYLNQVGLVVCKFTKLVLESFMNCKFWFKLRYSYKLFKLFTIKETRWQNENFTHRNCNYISSESSESCTEKQHTTFLGSFNHQTLIWEELVSC